MGKHLIVLVHGINGNSSDLDYFCSELCKRLNSDNVVVKSMDSHTAKTNHGIEVCGSLVAAEMHDMIRTHRITKLSCIGHSMGGLTLRYALSVLHSAKVIDDMELVSYITLATPHLSSIAWEHLLWQVAPIAKTLGVPSLLMGPTGKQLFLQDIDDYNQKALLERMATDPEFLNPLARFKQLLLYGNLAYDYSVHFGTSMILRRHQRYSFDWNDPAMALVPLGDENPGKAHGHETVERMVTALQKLPWTRVGVKPSRWLTAHTDIVSGNREEGKAILEDIWKRIKDHHM